MSSHERKNHNRTARHTLYSVTFATLRIVPHLFPQFLKLRCHALVAHTAVITRPIAYFILVATAEAAQKFIISHSNTPFFCLRVGRSTLPQSARYVLVCHVHDFASVVINDSHTIEAILFTPIASNHVCLFADVLKPVCLLKLASVLVIEHYGKQVAIGMGQLWPFRRVCGSGMQRTIDTLLIQPCPVRHESGTHSVKSITVKDDTILYCLGTHIHFQAQHICELGVIELRVSEILDELHNNTSFFCSKVRAACSHERLYGGCYSLHGQSCGSGGYHILVIGSLVLCL
nr:MAG TPA: hypothetical protein [Caudoviricetes sp.]